ncbi:hypothetical protein [Pediococcus acidilactici]|uniref:hypothetical protein n=1 Tax=Pediococcus acidilactici TaxID=1254 RepID=UPI001300C449|nr:hypothetical protein [Pediococcus acidilactici]
MNNFLILTTNIQDARLVFPIFTPYQFGKELFEIRQSFKLTVQGDNPVKNLRLEEFKLSKEDEQSLNFGPMLRSQCLKMIYRNITILILYKRKTKGSSLLSHHSMF